MIEVALGWPDEKHLTQIVEALEDPSAEVWLLTRINRVDTWQKAFGENGEIDKRRVVVRSVEAFVGQNIAELAKFGSREKARQLKALFDMYNERWIKTVGVPGMRVELKSKSKKASA